MSKNTTTPEFEVGDEVLIFADSEGFYVAERADIPLLRRATIRHGLDEEGDYGIDCPPLRGKYATEARVFPLGTILVDGDPIRPKPQEQPEGHSLHSDGGMLFSADQIITGGTIDPSMTFTIEEISAEAKELLFGGVEVNDPYQEFLDEVASTLNNRGAPYGGVEDNFADIAAMWSAIAGVEIRADQVGLMMIALKLVRANKTNKRDNLLDIVGYAAHVAKIQEDSVDEA